jgi:hypothetical protein
VEKEGCLRYMTMYDFTQHLKDCYVDMVEANTLTVIGSASLTSEALDSVEAALRAQATDEN